MRGRGLMEVGKWIAIVAVPIAIATVLAAAGDTADSAAAKAVADQVRAPGLACTEPVSAARDAAESKPDEPIWILTCRDVRYRVRLMGDRPAKIERLQ